jgi:hypothetical protein
MERQKLHLLPLIFCRFLLTALLLAPLTALHAAERKLGRVVSNHTTTLVMKAWVQP